MAAKIGTGFLMPVVMVVAVVAAVPGLRDKAVHLFGDVAGGTELIGDDATQFMVARSAASDVHKCMPHQIVSGGGCGELKFVTIDAARMPRAIVTTMRCCARWTTHDGPAGGSALPME
jgi:hypothetical protein